METIPSFTIALVDDQEANRYALARYLREAGYLVQEGSSGQAALNLAQQKPDLLILDVHLPDANGIQICQQLKRNPDTAHLLVLQTSALFTSTQDRVQGLESGADAYLTAPFEPRELLAQIKALLRLKTTESALRQSEERFRSFLMDNPDPFFAVDSQGQFVLVNAACEALSGYAAAELLQMKFLEICAPDQREQTLAVFERGLRERKSQQLETAMIRQDGQRVDLLLTGSPVFNEPQGLQLYCAAKDITERKRTEEALRQSEERYEQQVRLFSGIASTTPDFVYVFDRQGRFQYANRRLLEVWGLELPAVIGKSCLELGYEPWHHDMHMREIQQVIATKRPIKGEVAFKAPLTGIYGIYEYIFTPVLNPDGEVELIAGTTRDVTERKQAERKLRQSENKYRLLFEKMGEGFVLGRIIYDEQGKPCDCHVLEVNPAYEQLTGLSREALLTNPIKQLLPGLEQSWINQHAQVVKTGQPLKWQHHDKHIGHHYEVISFRPDADLFASIFTVITERKRAEEKIRQLNSELEQRVQMRTADLQRLTLQLRKLAKELTLSEELERRRIAHVLHDNLQQLLVAAQLQMQGLQIRSQSKPVHQDLQDILNIQYEAIQVSRSLTYDLSPPVLQESNLAAALRWLGGWFEKRHGLQVTIEAEQTVIVPEEELRITLFRSVQELLFNAVKHAQVKTALVTVRQMPDQATEIVVKDNGRGFDPVQLCHQENIGTGFGLFHLREQLELIGGLLKIDSVLGKGSCFTLVVPSRLIPAPIQPKSGSPSVPSTSLPRQSDSADRRKIHILLADDHPVIREGLVRVIQEHEQFEVVGQAADGLQAIELARALQPEVILMDVSMPRLNGIEATQILRTEMPHIKVIGLSMFEDEAHNAAMRKAGALTLLQKSSPATHLVTTILHHVKPTR